MARRHHARTPPVRDFASITTSSCDAISQYVDHEPFDTGRLRSALLTMDDDYASLTLSPCNNIAFHSHISFYIVAAP
jgi:hypothetical protein